MRNAIVLWFGKTKNTSTSFELRKICNEVHRITKDVLYDCQME